MHIKYRKVADRPRDPAKWDEIADVVAALSIPVIANGDVLEYDDFSRIKTATGTHMIRLIESNGLTRFTSELYNLYMFLSKALHP